MKCYTKRKLDFSVPHGDAAVQTINYGDTLVLMTIDTKLDKSLGESLDNTLAEARRDPYDEPMPVPQWYQIGEVWLVIGILASAVIVGLSFLTISIYSWDGLVVDDYYRRGKEINKVLVRDQVAERLNISAVLTKAPGGHLARLEVSGANDYLRQAFRDTQILKLRLLHPTLSGEDREVLLHPLNIIDESHDDATLTYGGEWPTVRAGTWIVHVESADWRLTARTRLPLQDGMVLTSGDAPHQGQ